LSLDNADQPVVHIQTLKALIDENVWQRRFSAWLFSLFASLALCLSGLGIYGVVSYITASRRRDFGIHISLGAGPARLFYLAALRSLLPVAAGIAAGALGSYWTGKWVAALLYKTGPFDPVTTIASTAILVAAAFAAVTGPALRAMRVDPAITLRCE
jgi:ABC-type antimicrobial peptide transport system permease subunit